MNAFDQKMMEQMALVTSLVMTINSHSNDFSMDVEYNSRVNQLTIRTHDKKQKYIYKMVGKHRVYYILKLDTYLTAEDQLQPFYRDCTIEQMVHALTQIRQALIENHTHENNHEEPIADLFTTTTMDEWCRTHGQLHTFRSKVRNGQSQRPGREQTGRISATA